LTQRREKGKGKKSAMKQVIKKGGRALRKGGTGGDQRESKEMVEAKNWGGKEKAK